MGQYYLICNLDKAEHLTPETFGDGLKLREFGMSAQRTLTGLAILTAVDNAEDVLLPRTAEDSPPRDRYGLPQAYDEAVAAGWQPRNRQPDTIAAWAGRWAGDRIVTAGDYMPEGLHMTKTMVKRLKTQLRQAAHRAYRLSYPRGPLPTDPQTATANLYQYAWQFYDDISFAVAQVMRACEFTPNRGEPTQFVRILEVRLGARLVHAWLHDHQVLSGKADKSPHDLRWLTLHDLEYLLNYPEHPKERENLKKWLLKQQLREAHRHLVQECYTQTNGLNFSLYGRVGRAMGSSTWRVEIPPLPRRPVPEPTFGKEVRSIELSDNLLPEPAATSPVVAITCEMESSCQEPVTHIDDKGWVYCTRHGITRRHWRRCRKLRPHELRKIQRGERVTRY